MARNLDTQYIISVVIWSCMHFGGLRISEVWKKFAHIKQYQDRLMYTGVGRKNIFRGSVSLTI